MSSSAGAGMTGGSERTFERKEPHCMIHFVGIFMDDNVRHRCVEGKLQATAGSWIKVGLGHKTSFGT